MSIQLLFIFFSCLTIGCSKAWLDEKTSESLAVPSSLQHYQLLIQNTEMLVRGRVFIPINAADEYTFPDPVFQGEGAGQAINIYSWSHDFPYVSVSDWNKSYGSIVYCNVILEGLEKLTPDNTVDINHRNILKGQALFYRAFTFFELAQVFAPAYNKATATSDLGIPLRLNADVNVPSTRASVKETYNRIVDDLLEAKALLPASSLSKTLPTSIAADALLARIYLSMEEYEKAKHHSNLVLNLQSELLNYESDPEISSTGTYRLGRLNKEVLFHATSFTTTFNRIIDTSLYNLYNPEDIRKTLFFSKNSSSGVVSFIGSYDKGLTLFVGLTTGEMYLIRAECAARLGDKDAALADVDTLLKKRYTSTAFIPSEAADAEEALKLVLIERQKEMILRGQRWSDIRRLNKDPRFAKNITRKLLGQSIELEAGSFRFTYPIPDDIIEFSGVLQNPGW